MAFTPLNSSEILAGEPTKQELFTTIKDDLDDHEARIADNEAFTTSTLPLVFEVQGQGEVIDGLAYIRVPFGISITGVKLFIFEAGSSGTLSVDVQRKTGAGSFASILAGNITAAYTSGDLFVVAASGVAISSIAAGSFLRLDIDALQLGVSGFQVLVEYTVNV